MSKTSLGKSRIRFLLLGDIHQNAVDTLKAADYTNIEYLKTVLSGDELEERIVDTHFIGIRPRIRLTEEAFGYTRRLIAANCFCIGTNQIDLNTARGRGVAVFNASYSNTCSVAELILAKAILLLRGIPEKNTSCHRGDWIGGAANSLEIHDKKLDIIGYGSIDTQLSVFAEALGVQVSFYDTVTKLPLGNVIQVGNLHGLLDVSDIVSLHVSELPSARWMIGEKKIHVMKRGDILISTAYDTVTELDHLAATIKDEYLISAATGVFPVEPRSSDEGFTSPLRGLDRVILTPCIDGSTIEVQADIGLEMAEKLVKYSDNGASMSSVNFLGTALPSHPDECRLLYIHANIPGAMSRVNRVFTDNNINVSNRYLQANDKVGYAVIDVDAEYSDLVLEKLQWVSGTIRSRVLL